MKEFANIGLATINSHDLSYLNLVKARFNAYLSNIIWPYDRLLCNPELAIKHIENCIQANLSLSINGDDKLISMLPLMPEENIVAAFQIHIAIISNYKSTLAENGLPESIYNTATYDEKLKAIQHFKKNYTGYNKWSNITDELAHKNCCLNLLIARLILHNINILDQDKKNRRDITLLSNTLALQICHYIEIINYISTRLSVLIAPHFSSRCPYYINEMLAIKNECCNKLTQKLLRMQGLPNIETKNTIFFYNCFGKSLHHPMMGRDLRVIFKPTMKPKTHQHDNCY